MAILFWQRPNLLLLDEPTNHLDLEMREALTLALQETDAGVILVSHDRHLLRTTADTLYLVADGQARPFDGDLDDYATWLATGSSEPKPAAQGKPAKPARETRQEAQDRKALAEKQRPLQKEVDKLEKQISGWQAEKKLLDARIAEPALYAPAEKALLADLLKHQATLAHSIETAEARWLEIQAALDSLATSA